MGASQRRGAVEELATRDTAMTIAVVEREDPVVDLMFFHRFQSILTTKKRGQVQFSRIYKKRAGSFSGASKNGWPLFVRSYIDRWAMLLPGSESQDQSETLIHSPNESPWQELDAVRKQRPIQGDDLRHVDYGFLGQP